MKKSPEIPVRESSSAPPKPDVSPGVRVPQEAVPEVPEKPLSTSRRDRVKEPAAETPPPPRTPEAPPAPPPEPPVPAPAPTLEREKGNTFAAIARIEKVEGVVTLPDGTGIKANHVVLEGQGLRTGGASLAVLRFPDGTRIEAAGDTLFREIRAEGGRRIALERGTLVAEVVRQAPGTSIVFTTPHGEASVLGTTLRLIVDPEKTRLEVTEGKVRLRRLPDGRPMDVTGGHYAVAAPGANPTARPLPIDEILILPHQVALNGVEWRLVRDPNAVSGLALENIKTSNRFPDGINADASRATFAFKADADKAYSVWVRGCAVAPKDVMSRDAVFLEWPEGQVVETPGPSKGKGGHPSRALFNGFMHRAGYWWVGGDADGEADASAPVTVRFSRTGWQTLRIYAYEPPVRIDAVWISATQKTRPPDAHAGPR
jgi:hypothetical protein